MIHDRQHRMWVWIRTAAYTGLVRAVEGIVDRAPAPLAHFIGKPLGRLVTWARHQRGFWMEVSR